MCLFIKVLCEPGSVAVIAVCSFVFVVSYCEASPGHNQTVIS
jgi:hypothetical protein